MAAFDTHSFAERPPERSRIDRPVTSEPPLNEALLTPQSGIEPPVADRSIRLPGRILELEDESPPPEAGRLALGRTLETLEALGDDAAANEEPAPLPPLLPDAAKFVPEATPPQSAGGNEGGDNGNGQGGNNGGDRSGDFPPEEEGEPPRALVVPRYNYIGLISEFAACQQIVEEMLHEEPSPLRGMPEVTERYRPQIEAVQAATIELARDLGVDITARLQPDHLHIYPRSQAREFHKRLHKPPRVAGITTLAGHQLLLERRSKLGTLARATHESGHALSYWGINPSMPRNADNTGVTIILAEGMGYNGYANLRTGEFLGLQEGLLDLTAVEQARDYWPEQAALSQFQGEDFSIDYGLLATMLDHAISQADDPAALFKALQRGMFTGERNAAQALAAVVGEEAFSAFAQVVPSSKESMDHALQAMGCAQVSKSEPVMASGLLQWLEPRLGQRIIPESDKPVLKMPQPFKRFFGS
jgi:hypothetical protein